MRRWLCWFLGHAPRGPIAGEYSSPGGQRTERQTYECEHCARPIRFLKDYPNGWIVVRKVTPL